MVRGRVHAVFADGVLVDTGGVGYEVRMPARGLAELPREGEVVLYTHVVWREDSIALYGFPRPEEKEMFRILLEVSGVGPRLALSVLSAMTVEDLLYALAAGEAHRLQAIHGVGKKTAARLCVDLRERARDFLEAAYGKAPPPTAAPGGAAAGPVLADALSALENLGYRPAEAERILARAREEIEGEPTVEELVRRALRLLAGTR
nr:Holliday junction branch migration protein RuvA [Dissulfurirhabdus thermomarina]